MAKSNSEIKEHYYTVRTNDKGMSLEINLVSWYGREPKIDVRYWDKDHEKCGKGLHLEEQEWDDFVRFIKKEVPDKLELESVEGLD